MNGSFAFLPLLALLVFSIAHANPWTYAEDVLLMETIQDACVYGQTGVYLRSGKPVPAAWFHDMYERYGYIAEGLEHRTVRACMDRYGFLKAKVTREAKRVWSEHRENLSDFSFLRDEKPIHQKKRAAALVDLPALLSSDVATILSGVEKRRTRAKR